MAPTILESRHLDSAPAKGLLQNDASKLWIVQKFGGTSIGKFATEIAENIVM